MLDHILLGCNDLDQGIAFIEQRTGVRPAIGGVHPGRGTRNALLSLGRMRYLEVIAPDPQQQIKNSVSLLTRLRELTAPTLVDWAVHTDNLDNIAQRLTKQQLAFQGPNKGSRKRPDGGMLNWQTLTLDDDRHGMIPFFIQWGAGTVHPSSDAPAGCELAGLAAISPNPAALVDLYQRCGIQVQVERGDREHLQAQILGPRGSVVLS